MHTTLLSPRTVRMLSGLVALATAVGCNDSTGPDDDHAEEVAEIRLTVTPAAGTATTYTIRTTGMTPTPMQLRVGTVAVTAQVFDEDGENVTAELGNEYEVRLTPATGSSIGYSFTNAFSGTLTTTAQAVGNRTVQVELFHTGENHADFGPITVNVAVTN